MILDVENLTGGYFMRPVLKDLSFTVNEGELVGLIGLNGAGKSTTIKHIIGLLQAQSGQILVGETSIKKDPINYKKKLAYIPETPVLYEELTLKEHLEMTIMAYDLDYETAFQKALSLLKIFRLDNKLDWFPANFSKGMKQKVMITCAFMTEAELFIIDEPFLGLDPLATRDLLNLIDQVKQRGAGVLMSTHVLSTAEKYCDRFVMIDQGSLKAKGTLAELRDLYGDKDASLADIYLGMTELAGEEHA